MFSRVVVVSAVPQFAVSCALLAWASLATTPVPRWGGVLDALVAFTIVGTAMWLYVAVGQAREPHAGRIYTTAALLPPFVLVLVWLARERVDMNILLPGLAWRLFIILEMLPLVAAVWMSPKGTGDGVS